ncbi:alpha-tocopherol transfer protein-like [Frankliniella occidentalis]|uniref:Alpha-tocopherol transfer protein-like n=1 Tax=Frankliniella occidentalis TaxID=133901 RepID=A0A9C6TN70_FRAOC|nr:alpha-tocopherol transfer protein-like [Frankliniella occidentalis]
MDHYRHLESAVPAMEPMTQDQSARVLAEYGMTKEGMARDVATIRAWLEKQPHLPKDDVDDMMIERLLIRCKNSVVVAQRRLDDIYTVRSDMPEFYRARDPLGPEMQSLMRVVGLCVMPRLTPDLTRVSLIRLLDQDVDKFSVEGFIKLTFMGQDVILREPACLGDVVLFDARGYTLAHAVGANPVLIRKAVSHVKRTYPARVTGIHVLFPPSFADRILNIIKSFLPEKLANRIHTHNSLESLLDHIPQDILPKDYGGQEASSDELCETWNQKLISYREYFLNTEKLQSNETLRLEKRKQNTFSNIEGSFRKLDID